VVVKPRPPRYCRTCGHTNDRHKIRVFGKTGTSCEAPLEHGTTCPCKQWSSPLPPKPIEAPKEEVISAEVSTPQS